ncbi:DUF4250 domain-containing protein [Clostridium sp. MSJ-8]|uniref:DUF4250 domain-containing protein n=1 Tax=Clostridium sp. MSJ-8 TaxID=2841510 RepID=UPI001C0EBDA7|nr:DUF4250 domain-containing protein [Clostridium sp. MSJ-8]MBU5487912.1 DUF4250 domain-containing protein [Clostridium sp. MSJ-8]
MEISLKDPNILLSMINMKLRDMYSNLDNLCEDLDIDRVELEKKLEKIGYSYNSSVNQFK